MARTRQKCRQLHAYALSPSYELVCKMMVIRRTWWVVSLHCDGWAVLLTHSVRNLRVLKGGVQEQDTCWWEGFYLGGHVEP